MESLCLRLPPVTPRPGLRAELLARVAGPHRLHPARERGLAPPWRLIAGAAAAAVLAVGLTQLGGGLRPSDEAVAAATRGLDEGLFDRLPAAEGSARHAALGSRPGVVRLATPVGSEGLAAARLDWEGPAGRARFSAAGCRGLRSAGSTSSGARTTTAAGSRSRSSHPDADGDAAFPLSFPPLPAPLTLVGVTEEPAGGSPTGHPTGRLLLLGAADRGL